MEGLFPTKRPQLGLEGLSPAAECLAVGTCEHMRAHACAHRHTHMFFSHTSQLPHIPHPRSCWRTCFLMHTLSRIKSHSTLTLSHQTHSPHICSLTHSRSHPLSCLPSHMFAFSHTFMLSHMTILSHAFSHLYSCYVSCARALFLTHSCSDSHAFAHSCSKHFLTC